MSRPRQKRTEIKGPRRRRREGEERNVSYSRSTFKGRRVEEVPREVHRAGERAQTLPPRERRNSTKPSVPRHVIPFNRVAGTRTRIISHAIARASHSKRVQYVPGERVGGDAHCYYFAGLRKNRKQVTLLPSPPPPRDYRWRDLFDVFFRVAVSTRKMSSRYNASPYARIGGCAQ